METAELSKTNREVKIYITAAFIISWLLWLSAMLIQNCGISLPVSSELFLRAGGFAPSICGLVFAYRYGGKAEFGSLLKSMLDFRFKKGWFLLILLVMPGVSAVSCLIVRLIRVSLPQPQFELWFIPVAFL